MAKWTEEQKVKALTIARASSAGEASKSTGIPRGTILRWMSESKRIDLGESSESNQPSKKLEQLQQIAIERAIDEAGDYIAERLKALADELYGLAQDGVKEARDFMANPGTKDRDSAAWLRSVVGAMHYGIQDAQLLSGKPTARPEVMNRHEYDITQRIIADPEAVETANLLLRRAAGRDAGAFRVDGKRGPMDTV